MARSLSQDKQNNIKFLLQSGCSYSVIMKRIPGVKKSTICDIRKGFSLNEKLHLVVKRQLHYGGKYGRK
ncbi:uncharacterized protein BX663DRAFT_174231, partial [Cokeromyces recurvatus]|uniref:uncharacterized protein n=1 Tax=Cokeromyces recurvatus TaxID=90255 RepID=UPI0022202DA5